MSFLRLKQLLGLAVFFIFFISSVTFAATRIWQQANNPSNYVVLEKLKIEEAEDLILNHPYTFDAKKLTDMLLSLRYNKAFILKKSVEDQQVFFDVDLIEKRLAPHLVEAFQRATPEQVVVFSIVQKDPLFIIRNDRLNVVRAFVGSDGLHLSFIKNDAKLTGDYQAHTMGQRMVEQSKGLRITLEPQEGQKLSFTDPKAIILDLNYDFAALVDKKTAEDEVKEAEKKRRKKTDSRSESQAVTPVPPLPPPTRAPVAATPVAPAAPQKPPVEKTPAARLKALKELKDQGLITPYEYEAKKKEILKEL